MHHGASRRGASLDREIASCQLLIADWNQQSINSLQSAISNYVRQLPAQAERPRERERIQRVVVVVPRHDRDVGPLADLRAARAGVRLVAQVTGAGEQSDELPVGRLIADD